ncbi:ABC transporter substrate-binding protein [Chthonobacter rhizosphaerae]|uniref:ABC transporter substrate-binding protein n=1 Tax=Chthonobacter rhizosphaerae TaxID=2735553 RepID=UPI001AED762E|nr:ABC transporter substrate-binding protein [Chthonobacter rhizosphaerae]
MTFKLNRRQLLSGGVGLATLGFVGPARADDTPIKIGYWPISAGLPFYTAVEKGFFKDAGLNVEPVKLASANQIVEGMIAGRVDGSANGTASATLALGDFTSPGFMKIFCSNPSNRSLVLDQFLVAKDSPIQTIGELADKRVACGPGIQNVALAKTVLERNGVKDPSVIELPIGQHVAALAAGQIDACYTLEPTGTVGTLKGISRILESGVISKYILGDPDAPWYGGSASLTTSFLNTRPETAKAYMEA